MAAASAPTTADSAVIVNSGSTNAAGYRIVVARSGAAERTLMPRRRGPQGNHPSEPLRIDVPAALAERFYSDLETAKPLTSLPVRHCAKSVSFGTTLTVEFAGEKTPDLSCGDGGDSRLQALIRDTNEIVKLFRSE
jgi:hypothetical protein